MGQHDTMRLLTVRMDEMLVLFLNMVEEWSGPGPGEYWSLIEF